MCTYIIPRLGWRILDMSKIKENLCSAIMTRPEKPEEKLKNTQLAEFAKQDGGMKEKEDL